MWCNWSCCIKGLCSSPAAETQSNANLIPVISPGSPHGALHSNERGQNVFYVFIYFIYVLPFWPTWRLFSTHWSTSIFVRDAVTFFICVSGSFSSLFKWIKKKKRARLNCIACCLCLFSTHLSLILPYSGFWESERKGNKRETLMQSPDLELYLLNSMRKTHSRFAVTGI